MQDREQVELNYTCPHCGQKMVMFEDDEFVWFGCSRCVKFYRAKKGFITLKFTKYSNGEGYFDWKNMLRYMYERVANALTV